MRRSTALLFTTSFAASLVFGCGAKPDEATCTKLGEKYFELAMKDAEGAPDPAIAEAAKDVATSEKAQRTEECKGGNYTKEQADCAVKAADLKALEGCLAAK